jgi:hypothetical protein
MGYIENSVMSDERLIYSAKVKVYPLILPMLFGAFLVMVALSGLKAGLSSSISYRAVYTFIMLAGLYPFFFTFMNIKNTEIGFTDKRFIVSRGVLRRNVLQLDTRGVTLIVAGKGLLGKFLNYGSIAVFSSGELLAVVKGVGRPDDLIVKLQDFQESL